jgi:cytochrome c-type biogenesis protein CcmE
MRAKFWIGGAVIVAAVVYLIVSSIGSSAQYYLTVKELRGKSQEMAGRNLRVAGFVIGESIAYNPQASSLSFDIVDSREELTSTVKANTLKVVYTGPKPDLLQNEAQAIAEGKLNPDGTFVANNLLLKCPTRYEDQIPTATSVPAQY